jgi:hypothetical protein
LELGGVELFGAGTVEALLEACDDLVFAGELGLEVGVFDLQMGDFFLKLTEAVEELLDVWWGGVFHGKCSSN